MKIKLRFIHFLILAITFATIYFFFPFKLENKLRLNDYAISEIDFIHITYPATFDIEQDRYRGIFITDPTKLERILEPFRKPYFRNKISPRPRYFNHGFFSFMISYNKSSTIDSISIIEMNYLLFNKSDLILYGNGLTDDYIDFLYNLKKSVQWKPSSD